MEHVSYEFYQGNLVIFKHLNGEVVDQTEFDLNEFDLNDMTYHINNNSFMSKEGLKIQDYIHMDKLTEDVKYHSEFV